MENDRSLRTLLIAGFLLVVVLVISRAPLFESFWLDETLSLWVVRDSFGESIERAWDYKQSIFFHGFLWGWARLTGSAEWFLRLPSFVLTVVSALLVIRIGSRLGEKHGGLFAAILFLVSESSIVSAVSCRPYAFAQVGILLCLESFLALRHSTSAGRALLAVSGFAAAVLFHQIFAFAILVPLALVVVKGKDGLFGNRYARLALIAIIAVSLAGFAVVFHYSSSGPALGFAAKPTFKSLAFEIIPPAILVYVLVPSLLGIIYGGIKQFSGARSTWLFLVLWSVVPPILFFVASVLMESSIFVPRYWVWQTPGLALLLGFVLANAARSDKWWLVAVGFLGLVVFREGTRQWIAEPWRELAAEVQQNISADGACKQGIQMVSGLVEARDRTFVEDTSNKAYLTAPLAMYGVSPGLLGPTVEAESTSARDTDSVKCLAGVTRFGARTENKVFTQKEAALRANCRTSVHVEEFAMLRLVTCAPG